jgi:hypothetical protein
MLPAPPLLRYAKPGSGTAKRLLGSSHVLQVGGGVTGAVLVQFWFRG